MPRRVRRSYARRRSRRTARKYRRRRRLRAAASGQRQTAHFVVKSSGTDNIIIQATTASGFSTQTVPNYAGTACIGAYQNLIKSSYFTSIAKMYDQVRVDWMKVKITPTMSVLLQGQKQALFVSAWDRNGVTNPKNIPGFAEIASYSSAFQRPINLDATVWSVTRRINAVTIAEKSLFLPTSALLSAAGGDISDTGLALTIGQTLAAQWNPQLLIGVMLSATSYSATIQAPTQTTLAQTQTWNYFTQIEFGLTFRGLRYDIPDGPAPMVQTYSVINPVAQPKVGYATAESNAPLPPTQRPMIPDIPPFLNDDYLVATRMRYNESLTSNPELGLNAPFLAIQNRQFTLTTNHPGFHDVYQFVFWDNDEGSTSVGIAWLTTGTNVVVPRHSAFLFRLVGSIARSVAVNNTISMTAGRGTGSLGSVVVQFHPSSETHNEKKLTAVNIKDVYVMSSFERTGAAFQSVVATSRVVVADIVDLWAAQQTTNPVIIGGDQVTGVNEVSPIENNTEKIE